MAVPFVKNFDDLAENMANPNPDRPIQEAVAGFGRSICDSISNSPTFEKLGPQGIMGAVCKPYWDSQGYDGPVVITPEFSGGQCATPYRVRLLGGTFTREFCTIAPINYTITGAPYTINSINGPLVEVGWEYIPGSTFTCGSGRVLRTGVRFFARNAAGDEFTAGPISPGDSQGEIVSMDLNIEVIRLDGLADDCGDPDEIINPGPNPAPDPGPLPPGTGPQVNIRGGVILVLPPTLEINPEISIELPIGEINLGSGTADGTPAAEPLPGDELTGAGSGSGGGENEFGDPPDGERWVGCCIRITSSPPGAGVIPSSIPHYVYPVIVGNARLKFLGLEGLPTYDTPIQKRQETSCLWEPVRGMAPVGAFVNLLPGYSYTVTPYSVPSEQ